MSTTRPIPLLDLVRLHAPLAADLHAAFDDLLDGGRYIGGPAVEGFERALAAHVGAARAVGVSSGTDGLLASLMALRVKPGDEIVTSPYTFIATAGAIARLGAKPVFADIEPAGLGVDPAAVEAAITPRTVGILPVHLFGQAADMDPILDIAARRGLWVLEDAAQAIGARYRERCVGTLGTAGVLSFFPAKNLGALGDAGAVITGDGALADRIAALRRHGGAEKDRHDEVGGNFRLDALQAAFLSVKLPHLARWEEGRRRVAERYGDLLAGIDGLALPARLPGRSHVYNQYVVRIGGGLRDAVRAALRAAGIDTAIYYPVPLHLQPCFAHLGHGPEAFPQAEAAARETLAIPVDPLIEEADQERVAAAIRGALD
jgi:dTDP-4-amino-4,6-dideoxygalactose transaminase